MQSKIFNRLFETFPTSGDLVFSKTGELLGLMVDKLYCALIGNLDVDEELASAGLSQGRVRSCDEFVEIPV